MDTSNEERERKIMSYFDLPAYNVIENMDFDKAVAILEHRGSGDLLKGMQSMQNLWNEYCTTDLSDAYACDDDFYEEWEYEMNAYNIVHDGMSPLFQRAMEA